VLAMDFRHCQILDPVGDAVAFPKSIEFWKDRRIRWIILRIELKPAIRPGPEPV
jgi:hypothetical protein